jgi:hypothetical protein
MAQQPLWSSTDKDSDIVLSNGDRTATIGAFGVGAVRSTVGVAAGKWYVEIVKNLRFPHCGIATAAHSLAVRPGYSAVSWSLNWNAGNKVTNSAETAYGSTVVDNDVVMMAYDAAAGKIWWGKNGTWFASGDPGAGTNEAFSGISGTIYLAWGSAAGAGDRQGTITVVGSYVYSPPSGFVSGWGYTEQSLTATSTVSASIAKTAHKYLTAAAVATTASMQRTISKFLVGTSTVTGTVQKVVSLTMAATSTVSAAILKMYAVTLAATSATTSTISRTTHKFLSATSATTSTISRIVAYGVTMTATSTVTATLATIRLFTMVMAATSAVTASMTRTISITLTAAVSAFAKPIQWVASMYAAIRGDKPNWNQCARCLKSMRPNKLLRQMEYRGPRLVWTGLYVCNLCEDKPQPQNITPRKIGGDPRPVPNARPRRTDS